MSVIILKPDEIGDFVIATGSMRLLAEKHGEENTTFVVRSELAALARREFPRAQVLGFSRPGRAAGLPGLWRTWRCLRRMRADLLVCLRSRRDFLHTTLFAAPRVKRRVAAENLLLRRGGPRRKLTEGLLAAALRPELVPYPAERGDLTYELASHRAVVSAALGRAIAPRAVLPRFHSARWRGANGWLLCPFSSRPIKDYSPQHWLEALRLADRSPVAIRLGGGPDQAGRLHELAATLRGGSLRCPVTVVPPGPLENFPDLVADADLVLAADTAAAHFACAIDAPAVIVDSGNNPGVYGPYGNPERQVWVTADRRKFGRSRWQETVPPSMVAAAIERASAA